MKALFYCIIIILTSSWAQPALSQEGALTFISQDESEFYLFLNNEQINTYPLNNVTATNLILKDYKVTIKWKNITKSELEEIVKVKMGTVRSYSITAKGDDFILNELSKSKKGTLPLVVQKHATESNLNKNVFSCEEPITNQEADELLKTVTSLDYPQDKVTIIKEKLSSTCLTVEQLSLLISNLDYESDKVEVVKHAYSYVYDRHNFSNLANIFEFPNEYEDILRYLKQQPSFY